MGKTKKTVKKLSKKEKQQRIDDIHAFTVQHHATQPQKAIELLTEAIELCRDIDNIPMLRLSLSRKAFGLRMKLLLDEALALEEEALNISVTHNLEKEQAGVCCTIAIIYYRKSEFQKAKEYFCKSAAMYEKLKNFTEQVGRTSDMALMCILAGESVEAFSYCQKAFTLCDTHSISPYPAELLHNTALIYQDAGDFEKAVHYYNEAYNVNLDSGDMAGQSLSLRSIATCYSHTKNQEQVLQYTFRALDLDRHILINPEKQSLYILAAELFCGLQQKEKANELLEKAWNLCKEKTPPAQKFDYFRIRALLLIEEKKYSEANILLEEALTIAQKHTMPFEVNSIYRLRGKIPPVEDQIESLFTALHLSETYFFKQVQPEIHHELSTLYESAGDTEKGLKHFKKYYELKEEIQAEKAVVRLQMLQIEHETDKLRQESEYNKVKLKELTSDVIQKSQILSEIRHSTQEALLQQGLIQKKTLHKVMEVAESGASSFWTLLEERASHVDGSLTEKILKISPDFTTVQLRIILLLKERLSNKEIAQILFVSERTVEYHRNIIRKKLNLGRTDNITAYLATL